VTGVPEMAHSAVLASMLGPGERPALAVTAGSGMEVTLADGRTVLDAGSLSSCLLGHCHPAITAAITAAAGTVYVNDSTGYAPRDRAGEDLLNLGFAGEPWADAVVFTVSSSEAGDLALMLAQMLTGRSALVCRELGYHGGVGLGREVSSHPYWSAGLLAGTELTPPLSPTPVRHLPVPECARTSPPDPEHSCTSGCLLDAPSLLSDAAAVIMDYSQGGVIPSPQYQDELAAIARTAGALWIADETVTGFGRIGRMFAFQRGRARPDMVTLGKGITGGAAPGGALVLSRRVVEAIGQRRWMTSSTFRGHPLAVAAVSAVLDTITQEDLIARAAPHSTQLAQRLNEIVERHPIALRCWGEGMLWFIELATRPEHREETWHGGGNTEPITAAVQRHALNHGALIGAYSGNLLWLIPPLIATPNHIAAICDALDNALHNADAELAAESPDVHIELSTQPS
jgi:4-aminobutyrate aminotransferase-like enzyme